MEVVVRPDKLMRSRLVALFLLLAIVFPSFLQFEHLLEEHHHTICKDSTLHIHEKNTDCKIYDFHFAPFNFEVLTFLPASQKDSNHRISTSLAHEVYCTPSNTLKLRGPPSYS